MILYKVVRGWYRWSEVFIQSNAHHAGYEWRHTAKSETR